jgi:hypothetical protein
VDPLSSTTLCHRIDHSNEVQRKENITNEVVVVWPVCLNPRICNLGRSSYRTADILTVLEVLTIEIIQGSRVTVCLSLSHSIRHARKLAL